MPLVSTVIGVSPEIVDNIDVDACLQAIRIGDWEDLVYPVRLLKDKEKRDKAKKLLPGICWSGVFAKRDDASLIEHSGFILIDCDSVDDVEAFKILLSHDKYVYAAWVSSSGTGVHILFKIIAGKHKEAFSGIANYIFENYRQTIDPQSKVPSRSFIVSFDPNMYIAEKKVPIFKEYVEIKEPNKNEQVEVFSDDDFKHVYQQIVKRNINICEDYDSWMRVGFAIASEYGESGKDYYHGISKISSKYNFQQCEKQYKYCLRKHGGSNVKLSTFFYLAKINGVQVASERTLKVRKATISGKSAGLNVKQIVSNLEKFENITGVDKLVERVFESGGFISENDSMVERLESYILNNYSLRRNTITRYIEQDEEQLTTKDVNTIYIAALKNIDKLRFELLERLLLSDFIKGYNPVIEYLESLPKHEDNCKEFDEETGLLKTPSIDAIASCIINDEPKYTNYFFNKWIVGAISAIHGEHSPLMFVLLGNKQGTGKTEFFRRLLPARLRKYYAESKLDAGKDDEILMTQKWIIMDDEMSGKSKKEIQRLKELTSKDYFSLREPYGRMNVDLKRLAVLCGTSNFLDILHDPTGNRRIIPVNVKDINRELYNSIDKEKLWAEAYYLWRNNFEWRVISQQDRDLLSSNEHDFEYVVPEKELLVKYFSNVCDVWLTTTEIKIELENMTNQKLSIDQLGKQLLKLGFEKESKRIEGVSLKRWRCKRINRPDMPF